MADHIGIRVVHDDDIVGAALDAPHRFVGELGRAHLRLEVVRGHLGGRHQQPIFAGIGGLAPTVEEEGDVGILLGLSGMELFEAVIGENLCQWLIYVVGGERHLHRQSGLVLGHRHEDQVVQPRAAIENTVGLVRQLRQDERFGQFTSAVGAEVEVDDRVTFRDQRDWPALIRPPPPWAR